MGPPLIFKRDSGLQTALVNRVDGDGREASSEKEDVFRVAALFPGRRAILWTKFRAKL